MAEFSDTIVPIVEYFKAHPQSHQGPPMLYQAFSQLDRSRLPDVIESVTSSDDMFIERDSRGSSDTRINTHITKNQEHHADVMLGLLYLMVGGADEAHDLVLPYSLPCDTDWGGPAVLDSPALGSACYSHALVHRTEGVHLGELGMIGWDNARSWFDETPQDYLLFDMVGEEFERLISQSSLSDYDRQRLLDIKGGKEAWNWKSMLELCSLSQKSATVVDMCDQLHNKEIAMLFDYCNNIVNVR